MVPFFDLLAKNPLLLLFLVASVGFPLGKLKIGGAALGTAMVLFVGIAFGSLDKRFKIPEEIIYLGLAVFVYCIGLSSSQGFFNALNKKGIKYSFLALTTLVATALAATICGLAMDIPIGQTATMFCGALTNTPALAGVLHASKPTEESVLLVGYAIAYPLGVLIPIALIGMARKVFKVNLKEEAASIPEFKLLQEKVIVETVHVCNSNAFGMTLGELSKQLGGGFTFGRYQRDDDLMIAHADYSLQAGDLVTVVGPSTTVDSVISFIGERTDLNIDRDSRDVSYRRIFVSSEKIAGRSLKDLNLPEKFDAVITRLKRGDIELIPDGNTILQLGDRVRVLAKVEDHPKLAKLFGDSYRALTETDMWGLCIGLTLGILLGKLPIPLPGGGKFELGLAGGPLIIAIIAGRLQRTGPLIWHLPYSANMTLREFGLTIFAAGVGVKAGYSFKETMLSGTGWELLAGGAATSFTTGMVSLLIGFLVLKIPLNLLYGIYTGTCTQPIALAYSKQQTKNEIPNTGYATVFPLATVLKILLAQIILNFGR